MKYAVVCVLDQTYGYLTPENTWSTQYSEWTIKHPEAQLFETEEEAEAASLKADSHIPLDTPNRKRYTSFIENVEDEVEFRSREDTW